MSEVPAAFARQVVARAANRCEYCGLSQLGQEAVFHVDHIIPRAANGPTHLDNLALACVSCSLRKGARLRAVDPESSTEAPLFHPRLQEWSEHFRWNGVVVEGITPTGRATVAGLEMNRPMVLSIRQEEIERGRHPPQ